MKNERQLANDILDQALSGNIYGANTMLETAVAHGRGKSDFRASSSAYLLMIFVLAALFLGIDALDRAIIDWL